MEEGGPPTPPFPSAEDGTLTMGAVKRGMDVRGSSSSATGGRIPREGEKWAVRRRKCRVPAGGRRRVRVEGGGGGGGGAAADDEGGGGGTSLTTILERMSSNEAVEGSPGEVGR